jgi:hypothetical protein
MVQQALAHSLISPNGIVDVEERLLPTIAL